MLKNQMSGPMYSVFIQRMQNLGFNRSFLTMLLLPVLELNRLCGIEL